MRNNQLNTQQIETTEKSEEIHHQGENPAKISPCDKTELTIQIIFTLAIIANFYTFTPTSHVAALIILFKYLTNFPEKLEEKESQEEREPPKSRKHIVGWMRRRKKKTRNLTWIGTKCTIGLILAMLTGTYIADTLVKYGSPNSPRQTLYSLAHDSRISNLPGSAFPIKRATTTRNRTKIRKDIRHLIISISKLLKVTLRIVQDIINVRNKYMRTITKKIIKKWIHLMGDHINAKNTQAYWSPSKCENCDLGKQRGPKPICPFCNIELIGLTENIRRQQ